MDFKGLTTLTVSFIKEQVRTIRLSQDSQDLRFTTVFHRFSFTFFVANWEDFNIT